jgi:hypothetical protein
LVVHAPASSRSWPNAGLTERIKARYTLVYASGFPFFWRFHGRHKGRWALSFKIEREEALRLRLDPDELPTGAIVGSVEIVDCVQNFKRLLVFARDRATWARGLQGNVVATRRALAKSAWTRRAKIAVSGSPHGE